MKKINHAVICAAGLGSRLGQGIPKALVNITDDKKIIDFQIDMTENIDEISVVVGYKHEKVEEYLKNIDRDVNIVHNKGYANNSTCYSIYLATKDSDKPYISIDGDLLINKNEFNNFVNAFDGETLLGITPAKTEDGVYAILNENQEILSFQRNPKTPYEWANIACISKPVEIKKDEPYVFPQFEKHLPLKSFMIENCYEVDTPGDLKVAIQNLDKY